MNHVVVCGAGFGGLNAVKFLGKHPKTLQVTLIDRRNYHLFQPLLYQVAMAGLSPAEIAVPVRSLLSHLSNVQIVLGEVIDVDLKEKFIKTDFGKVSYDYLVLACGASHSYFENTEWEEFAPGLKTLEQATEIRRRVLLAFELAERETNIEKQKALLTFIVVGGGPTGVELAGTLGEISRYTLSKDFVKIDPSRTRIILIEAGPRILQSFSENLSRKATRDLESLGVQVWTSCRVTEINAIGVKAGKETILSSTVLWAAGVKPSFLNQKLQVSLDSVGRVFVEKDLSLKQYPEVFVIGDQAHFEDADGNSLPGLAPIAIQQGKRAAYNILMSVQDKDRLPFRYFDKGQMAAIGRKRAIAQIHQLQIHGFFAWLAWLFVHIYYLIGFKNKVFVLLQWAWAYFSFKRGARLIVNKEWRFKD